MSQQLPFASARPKQSEKKIHVVVAQYYLDDRRLEQFLERLRFKLGEEGFESSLHVVDLRPASLPQGEMVRHHPFLDISAYRAGLTQWDKNGIVALLNDTLFVKHPWRLLVRKLIGLLPLLATIPVPAAAGVVHPSTDIVMIDDHNPTRQHLSTFLVAMNSGGGQLFADLLNELPREDDPLAHAWLITQQTAFPALVPLLNAHLGGMPNPWMWHGMQRRPDEALVQRKAVTVAIEYLFTCRLLRTKGCVLPMNLGLRFKFEAMLDRLLR